MHKTLQQVNYSQFCYILRTAAGEKIKNTGKQTYVYDQNNRVLAILKPASIDTRGRTSHTQYFARTAA